MTGKFANNQPINIIVNDHDTRVRLIGLLDKLSVEVRTFGDVKSFLAEPLSQAPSCLITEAVISDIDAASLIKDMRGHGLSTPIVVIADSDHRIDRAVNAIKAGAADFFQMPIGERDFIRRMQLILKRTDT